MLEFSGMNLISSKKQNVKIAWRPHLAELGVGESLLDKGCDSSNESRLRLSSVKYARISGKKFSARTKTDGVRVTRVS
jgi:hypothetical protein